MFQLAMDMVKFINDEIIDLFHAHGFTAESAGTCISLLSFKVPTYWRKFFGVCSVASEMAGGIVDVNGIF